MFQDGQSGQSKLTYNQDTTISNKELFQEVEKQYILKKKRKAPDNGLFEANFHQIKLPNLPYVQTNYSKQFVYNKACEFVNNLKLAGSKDTYSEEVICMYSLLREKIISYNDYF